MLVHDDAVASGPLRLVEGGVGTPHGDNWFHHGSLWGLSTQAVRTARGWSWVVAFNTRPEAGRRPAFELAYDRALWRAALAVPTWPEGDLF